MPLKNYLFTSESVSEGHPDKVSDRISDAIVDTYLTADPVSRVAVETLTTTNKIVLAGEVRTSGNISHDQLEEVARLPLEKRRCRGLRSLAIERYRSGRGRRWQQGRRRR